MAFAHDRPILLTDNSAAVNAKVKAALTYCGTTDVDVVGPAARVTAGTVAAIDAHVSGAATRVAASTGTHEQSVAFANWATSAGLLSWSGVGIARGDVPADALGASAFLGRASNPLLLTRTGELPTPVRNTLTANKEAILRVTYFGGPAAVSQTVRNAVTAALR